LEIKARNRFPPPISLKQFEDILREEWHTVPLEMANNLYNPTSRRTAAVLMAKDGPKPYQ
jgi:hypothetical protein